MCGFMPLRIVHLIVLIKEGAFFVDETLWI